jgi:membrane protease YdiL (CAAX protease family)
MNIKIRYWVIFILLAVIFSGAWFWLEYPHLSVIELSFDKKKAIFQAKEYLKNQNVAVESYAQAVVFGSDRNIDRYLQHTIGSSEEEKFVIKHNCDIFYWKVRFFKELQKEEYIVYVSPRTGRVVAFLHLIDDVAIRQDPGKENAKLAAEEFLRNGAGINLNEFDFHREETKRFDKRIEYVFSWEKKGVYIPWKEGEGGAKLLIGVTVTGQEIREFYTGELDLPEQFLRYVENQQLLGTYLYAVYFFIFLLLIASSIYLLLKRKNSFVFTLAKKWYFYAAVILVIINVLDALNNFQSLIMSYPTSTQMGSFLGLYFTTVIISIGFLAFGFILPAVSGESLAQEVWQNKQYCGLLYFIKNSFFKKSLAYSVILGYLLWLIMLGVQAGIFSLGQRFLGVWKEWYGLSQFSSSYIPLFGAFVVAVTASFSEEIVFRLFGITLAKKYLRNTLAAVFFASLVWGLGHTTYAIFPVWFRVLEVGILGLIYGFVFLRFGLVVLITAHYLFDVFWSSAAYIFGKSTFNLFSTSVVLLILPLIIAAIAYFLNKKDSQVKTEPVLSKTQKYNLEILVNFVLSKKNAGLSTDFIKNELLDNGWDYVLVDLAIQRIMQEPT